MTYRSQKTERAVGPFKSAPRRKKSYRSPELVEWGSILDLTQGIKGGFEDGLFMGGTQGV